MDTLGVTSAEPPGSWGNTSPEDRHRGAAQRPCRGTLAEALPGASCQTSGEYNSMIKYCLKNDRLV